MRRTIWLTLLAVFSFTALTACMSDDKSSVRGERRSAALVAAGAQSLAAIKLTMDGITPAGQAIEVLSYSWGGEKPAGGRLQFNDFQFTKAMDQVSPLLFENIATGRVIRSAVLTLNATPDQGHPVTYLTYTFENVLVTSVQNAGQSQGEQIPTESISFNYGRLQQETRLPLDASGNQGPLARFGWDIAAGRQF